jgi:ribonuclease P protein component
LQQPPTYTLSKDQKLKSKKQIDALFVQGKQFLVFPIKVVYASQPNNSGVQIGVSASKRYFKKAVDRNRIKRLLREAYRLQQHIILPVAEQQNIQVFFLYIDKVLPTQQVLHKKMKLVLQKLHKQF